MRDLVGVWEWRAATDVEQSNPVRKLVHDAILSHGLVINSFQDLSKRSFLPELTRISISCELAWVGLK